MKEFLKKADVISGKIDILYKGNKGYKNWIAGLLTILIYILTLSIAIFFFKNMFMRNDAKSYLVKKYIDSVSANFDQSNLFHFLGILDLKNKGKPIDFEKEKDMFLIESYVTVIGKNRLIKYTYGKCLYDDFVGLEDLYSVDFKNFYCLRSMIDLRDNYNNTKYINNFIEVHEINDSKINDKSKKTKKILNRNFVYPWIGNLKSDNETSVISFEINISKCQNNTNNDYECKSNQEIDNRLQSLVFQLKFIDNMFDVGNYSNPISRYINVKNSAIKRDNLVNLFLNFFSVSIITHDAFIFENAKISNSYGFDFNSESFNVSYEPLLHKTQFYILNTAQNYERSYTKLQNVAAEIAGIYKLFFIVGKLINYFFESYTNYIINNNLLEILGVELEKENNNHQMNSKENNKTKNVDKKIDHVSNALKNKRVIIDSLNKTKSNNLINSQRYTQSQLNRIDILNMKKKSNTQQINCNFLMEEEKNDKLNQSRSKKKISTIKDKNFGCDTRNINNTFNIMNYSGDLILNQPENIIENKIIFKEENLKKKIQIHNNCWIDFNTKQKSIIDRRTKFDIVKEKKCGFVKYLVSFFDMKSKKKIKLTKKLREILLDEINLCILHLDVVRIKKLLYEEIRVNDLKFHLDLNDVLFNYNQT